MGYSVYANDWEFYSFVTNMAYITIHQEDINDMYQEYGGIVGILDFLNQLKEPKEKYIALYYAPRSSSPDPEKERMFYTYSNALKIDAIREKIEEIYPIWNKEKYLLVALLLYEAATHTNTSGVFKAYHKGFGGHGKDALKRILGDIFLPYPVLEAKKAEEYRVFQKDALDLVQELDWEKIAITYLDPPYNQHQYGSNYHLLNTIALWDKPKIDNDFKISGKAGIRKDWIKTRSTFCYQEKAILSMQKLIQAIGSRYILLSYNTEGIIPIEVLLDILRQKGRVFLSTNPYKKYKGGRQSNLRRISNVEYIIGVDSFSSHSLRDEEAIQEVLLDKKIALFRDMIIDEKKLCALGWQKQDNVFTLDNQFIELSHGILTRFSGDKKKILDTIEKSAIYDKLEEIQFLFNHNPLFYKKRILNAFKKIAHKKYQKEFNFIFQLIKQTYWVDNDFKKIIIIAKKRGLEINF